MAAKALESMRHVRYVDGHKMNIRTLSDLQLGRTRKVQNMLIEDHPWESYLKISPQAREQQRQREEKESN